MLRLPGLEFQMNRVGIGLQPIVPEALKMNNEQRPQLAEMQD